MKAVTSRSLTSAGNVWKNAHGAAYWKGAYSSCSHNNLAVWMQGLTKERQKGKRWSTTKKEQPHTSRLKLSTVTKWNHTWASYSTCSWTHKHKRMVCHFTKGSGNRDSSLCWWVGGASALLLPWRNRGIGSGSERTHPQWDTPRHSLNMSSQVSHPRPLWPLIAELLYFWLAEMHITQYNNDLVVRVFQKAGTV